MQVGVNQNCGTLLLLRSEILAYNPLECVDPAAILE